MLVGTYKQRHQKVKSDALNISRTCTTTISLRSVTSSPHWKEEDPSSMQGVEPEISESEIEETGRNLKNGKSVGVDNMPPELIKNGGEITIDVVVFFYL